MLAAVPLAFALALLTPGEAVYTQSAQAPASRPVWPPKLEEPAPGAVEVLPVRGNVHVIIGAGGNVTVQTGEQGILLVDTGIASMSEKVWAAVQSIAPPRKPLRYVINTTEQPEHTGGNAFIAAKGETVPLRDANYTAGPQGTINYNRASVVSHQNVLNRMSAPTGQKAPTPPEAWPDNTYAIDQKRFYFNDEPVVMMNFPGNTDGNTIVFFRKSDVISTGDLIDLTRYPLIDIKAGGNIQAFVTSLNKLIDLCVPESHGAGGTLIVPGHGRIADHAEVAYYRDMLYIVRDRVQDMIDKGMTLAQVKAARPTRDWDTRYGSTTGSWTTDMFVEAVFTNLSGKK
jgi:glyoxylase-like metal-dependent hydrolase (beta-lactamase superfamily II)